jgi:hypothetical protein
MPRRRFPTGRRKQPGNSFNHPKSLPLVPFRNEQQLRAFIAYNFNNLQRDIAQGRGEYLTSMVTLAEIPLDRHRQLFAELQDRYQLLYPHESSPVQSLEQLLTTVGNRPAHVVAAQ